MPILDITLVGSNDDPLLARRLADAAGHVLGAEPGHTWVRLRRLAAADYAESGTDHPPAALIVDLIRHAWPIDPSEHARELRGLAVALAEVSGRPVEHVHVVIAPDGGGRIAFGGTGLRPLVRHRYASGVPWESIVGYSRAVRVGAQVAVTGTTATTDDGGHSEVDDAYAQTRRALANIARALAGVGARLDDVVRTRIFVTDIAHDWEAIGKAHAEVFGSIRPATSMVEVRALIAPFMRVEIEADAIVG